MSKFNVKNIYIGLGGACREFESEALSDEGAQSNFSILSLLIDCHTLHTAGRQTL